MKQKMIELTKQKNANYCHKLNEISKYINFRLTVLIWLGWRRVRSEPEAVSSEKAQNMRERERETESFYIKNAGAQL